jgi:hypothetical protein
VAWRDRRKNDDSLLARRRDQDRRTSLEERVGLGIALPLDELGSRGIRSKVRRGARMVLGGEAAGGLRVATVATALDKRWLAGLERRVGPREEPTR